MYRCVSVLTLHICLVCLSLHIVFPTMGSCEAKRFYSAMKKRIQLQNTINLGKLSLEFVDLAPPEILCNLLVKISPK